MLLPLLFLPIPLETPKARRRFDAKWTAEGECHRWTAAMRGKDKYGAFQIGYHTYRAHRVSYVWAYGEPNCDLHHTCGNTWCVNPDHIVAASAGQKRHRNVIPNHCANGHEFTPENTYLDPKTGWRQCITCKAARAAKTYAAMTDEERDALNAHRRETRKRITHDPIPCEACGLEYQPRRSDSRFCQRRACVNERQRLNRNRRLGKF